jgi:hypothetical protein
VIACPGCARFVRTNTQCCPFCDAVVRDGSPSLGVAVVGALLGLGIPACVGDDSTPEYTGAIYGGIPAATESTSNTGTETGTTGTSTGVDADTSAGTETSTDAGTSTGTTGTSTTGTGTGTDSTGTGVDSTGTETDTGTTSG